MMGELFLVADLGTSSVKVVAYDAKGSARASAKGDYETLHPRADWAEQRPDDWWRETASAIKAVMQEVEADSVRSISVCSQREGMVPVDSECTPLANCIIWLDTRTGAEGELLEEALGLEQCYRVTGLRVGPAWSLPKLLWIREHSPEVFRKASRFIQPGDFILARLSGRFVSDYSMASRTLMFDVTRKKWAEGILRRFGIPAETMPGLLESGTPVGPVPEQVAAELGLSPKTLVVAGGGDQQCAALGVGAIGEGRVGSGIGTGTALCVDLVEPRLDPECSLPLNCHAIPRHWEFEPCLWTSGGLLSWCAQEFYKGCEDSYGEMIREAGRVAPGCEGLRALPYFVGAGSPNWNADAKGAFVGLRLGHTRGHMARALFEAVGYEIRLNLEAVQANGIEAREVILSGGASRNQPLCQIVADVLGAPVRVTENADAASLGAGMLAALGAGAFDSIEAAVEAMLQPDRAVEVQSETRQAYDDAYASYKALYEGLVGYFGR